MAVDSDQWPQLPIRQRGKTMARAVVNEGRGKVAMAHRATRQEARAWAITQLHGCKVGASATVHEGPQLTDTLRVELLGGRPHVTGQRVWPSLGPVEVLSKHVGTVELSRAAVELAQRQRG